MKVFRVEREKYLESTLKGIGAAFQDGYRWNSLNTFLVYTAESRALAALEVFVHFDANEDLPSDRYLVEINIPDDIQILELKTGDLPVGWDSKPPLTETQFIGDDFVSDLTSAILKVPSCIVQREFNYLINPNHPDAARIFVENAYPFQFNGRLQRRPAHL